MSSSILTLENVTKSYALHNEELPILKGISMDIPMGDFVAIMGPSGSGKSTLLHLMGGLDRPTTGRVLIDEKDTSLYDDTTIARIRNEVIGFIFQNFFLLSYYSALENVCLPLVYAGTYRQNRHVAEE